MTIPFFHFYLGNPGGFPDPVEGNGIAENRDVFDTTTWTSAANPMALDVPSVSWHPSIPDADNILTNENLRPDDDAVQTHVSTQGYSASFDTCTNGTTSALGAAVVIQNSSRSQNQLPPYRSGGAYVEALAAKPIQPVTPGTTTGTGSDIGTDGWNDLIDTDHSDTGHSGTGHGDRMGGNDAAFASGDGPVDGGDDFDTVDLTGSAQPGGSLTVNYSDLNPETGQVLYRNASTTAVETLETGSIESVAACFCAGTLIKTLRGEIRAEDFQPGDMVLTRDAGYQPVRWVGRQYLSAAQLCARPILRPVTIRAGALGRNQPERDLTVSPRHRMLLCNPQTQLWFGEEEVLVAAMHLPCLQGVSPRMPQAGVTYVHLLFDDHQIICSDGAWSESFQPGEQALTSMDSAQRDEILAIFPELRGTAPDRAYPPARATLMEHEARVLEL